MQEIADMCGFTRSLLCKIETGRTVPAVATLGKIASALGVSVASFLSEESAVGTVFTPSSRTLSRTMTDKGYSFFAFASEKHSKGMQPYLFVAEKGKIGGGVLSHDGEEFVYVLEGMMKYRVGAVEYLMSPGDSLFFDSVEEHELDPVSDKVVYLAVFTER